MSSKTLFKALVSLHDCVRKYKDNLKGFIIIIILNSGRDMEIQNRMRGRGREGVRERECASFPLLAHSPKASNSQGWVRSKPDARNQEFYLHLPSGWQGPVPWVMTGCFQMHQHEDGVGCRAGTPTQVLQVGMQTAQAMPQPNKL